MKTSTRIISIALPVLIIAPFVVPVFSPWSRINCREYEIDLTYGQQRISRYLYGIPIQRRIEDTIITLQHPIPEHDRHAPRWEPVSTFGPYVHHSPHYIYHSATSQINDLALIWDYYEFDPAKRQSSARALLQEWQTTGSANSATHYLHRLAEEAEQSSNESPVENKPGP